MIPIMLKLWWWSFKEQAIKYFKWSFSKGQNIGGYKDDRKESQ